MEENLQKELQLSVPFLPQVGSPNEDESARDDLTSDSSLALPRRQPPRFTGVAEDFVGSSRLGGSFSILASTVFVCVLNGSPLIDLGASIWESVDAPPDQSKWYNYAMMVQWALYEACTDKGLWQSLNKNRTRVDLSWKGLSTEYTPRTITSTRLLLKEFIN